MRYRRVIEVAGVCVDGGGRTLLVPVGGAWALPGDQVRHGEHPVDTVIRAFREQAGAVAEVVRALDVLSDIDKNVHSDRIVCEVRLQTPVSDNSAAQWLDPASVSLTAATARVLGFAGVKTGNKHRRVSWSSVPSESRSRRQRFAAYALATDPDGLVLLTLISDGYPGAGSWHLPGGGTDYGESAAAGLAREIVEETGQQGAIKELMTVSHRHHRDARGPEGRPMDWHGVRVVYRVDVTDPTEPQVHDHGGSTAAAAWFTPSAALELPLTEIAKEMIITLA